MQAGQSSCYRTGAPEVAWCRGGNAGESSPDGNCVEQVFMLHLALGDSSSQGSIGSNLNTQQRQRDSVSVHMGNTRSTK